MFPCGVKTFRRLPVRSRYHWAVTIWPGKLLLLLAVGASLLMTTAVPATAASPDLKVQGTSIVDETTGAEFIPRGVNWPSFEYACVQGWGYSNLGATPSTAAAMREWNINTVRIPINQDCWLGDDGLPASDSLLFLPTAGGYRNAIKSFVEFLNEEGIAVILDLHWTGRNGTVADGLRPMADDRSDAFWVSAASTFRENPSVMFDLFNEPHSRWDPDRQQWAFKQSWRCWSTGGCTAPDQPDTETRIDGSTYTTVGMKSLVAAVRSTGATQPVILGGLDYANDLSEWKENAPFDDQLIAGFHNYPNKPCDVQSCWNQQIATLSNEVPVLTAEVGQNDCSSGFTTRYLDWADRHGIGYLAWAWWDLSGTPSNPGPGCQNFALIEDLDGTPTVPYGSDFKAHLLAPLDEEIPPPPPPEKEPARLRVISATIKGGKVRAAYRLNPLATGRTVSRLILAKGKLRRWVRGSAPVNRGKSRITMAVRPGWKAKKMIASYPGNALVRQDTSSRRPQVAKPKRKHQ